MPGNPAGLTSMARGMSLDVDGAMASSASGNSSSAKPNDSRRISVDPSAYESTVGAVAEVGGVTATSMPSVAVRYDAGDQRAPPDPG